MLLVGSAWLLGIEVLGGVGEAAVFVYVAVVIGGAMSRKFLALMT